MLENSKYELAIHLEEFSDEYEEEFLCDVLGKLSDDGEEFVRWAVARNPNIPASCACDLFEKLSDDEVGVRKEVARNRNLPESCACDILEKLSADNSSFVRRGVARNPNIPASCACDILEKLSDDDFVRMYVLGNPLWANCDKE